MKRFLILVCLVLFLGVDVSDSCAHGIKIFAAAYGMKISGYAYSSGGARIKNMLIKVSSPSGKDLGSVKTDEKGEFVFFVKNRCDHVLFLDTGDGHKAEWTVLESELPDDFPEIESARKDNEDVVNLSLNQKSLVVEKAVAKQLRPLREEIINLQQKIRMQDIIGGIGYILGLTGIVFYFLAKRKLAQR